MAYNQRKRGSAPLILLLTLGSIVLLYTTTRYDHALKAYRATLKNDQQDFQESALKSIQDVLVGKLLSNEPLLPGLDFGKNPSAFLPVIPLLGFDEQRPLMGLLQKTKIKLLKQPQLDLQNKWEQWLGLERQTFELETILLKNDPRELSAWFMKRQLILQTWMLHDFALVFKRNRLKLDPGQKILVLGNVLLLPEKEERVLAHQASELIVPKPGQLVQSLYGDSSLRFNEVEQLTRIGAVDVPKIGRTIKNLIQQLSQIAQKSAQADHDLESFLGASVQVAESPLGQRTSLPDPFTPIIQPASFFKRPLSAESKNADQHIMLRYFDVSNSKLIVNKKKPSWLALYRTDSNGNILWQNPCPGQLQTCVDAQKMAAFFTHYDAHNSTLWGLSNEGVIPLSMRNGLGLNFLIPPQSGESSAPEKTSLQSEPFLFLPLPDVYKSYKLVEKYPPKPYFNTFTHEKNNWGEAYNVARNLWHLEHKRAALTSHHWQVEDYTPELKPIVDAQAVAQFYLPEQFEKSLFPVFEIQRAAPESVKNYPPIYTEPWQTWETEPNIFSPRDYDFFDRERAKNKGVIKNRYTHKTYLLGLKPYSLRPQSQAISHKNTFYFKPEAPLLNSLNRYVGSISTLNWDSYFKAFNQPLNELQGPLPLQMQLLNLEEKKIFQNYFKSVVLVMGSSHNRLHISSLGALYDQKPRMLVVQGDVVIDRPILHLLADQMGTQNKKREPMKLIIDGDVRISPQAFQPGRDLTAYQNQIDLDLWATGKVSVENNAAIMWNGSLVVGEGLSLQKTIVFNDGYEINLLRDQILRAENGEIFKQFSLDRVGLSHHWFDVGLGLKRAQVTSQNIKKVAKQIYAQFK